MIYFENVNAQTSPWANIGALALNIREAFAREPEELDFVLPGLVRGALGVLVSPGGVGKSMFVLENAMSVAAGQDLFGIWSEDGQEPITQGKVVIVAVEDPVDVLQRRVHALGKGLRPEQQEAIADNLVIIPAYGLGFTIAEESADGLRIAASMLALRNWLRQAEERPRLIVFDTLNRCLGGANENTSTDMGKVMGFVENTCKEVGCAALIVHHANKASATSGNGHTQFAVRGSSAITDNCRWQVNMCVMSEKVAAERAITDEEERLKWVRFDVSKANYAPPMGNRWLYRQDEGVLVGALPPIEVANINDAPTGKARKATLKTVDDDEEVDW